MGEKMTLEQAFAALNYACEVICEYSPAGVRSPAAEKVMAAAATFRSHLTQPAQAVDVGAIREVIASHREEIRLCNKHDQESIDYLIEMTDKLTRALSAELYQHELLRTQNAEALLREALAHLSNQRPAISGLELVARITGHLGGENNG